MRPLPAQGELGIACVLLLLLEQMELHTLGMLEQLDLELLEPLEELELRSLGRSRNLLVIPFDGGFVVNHSKIRSQTRF